MRIAVVGPGAIGCLLAAFLSEAGRRVWLVDKDPARAEILSQSGISVEDAEGQVRTIPISATADPSQVGPVDFVCICVKAYDTASAAGAVLPMIGLATGVVSFQNGLHNSSVIAEAVGAERTICCTTSHGSSFLGTGRVRHAGTGPTIVAAFDSRGSEPAARFAGLLTESGMESRCADNVLTVLWSKLIVNAAVNPLTAIHDVSNGELLDDPERVAVMQDAAREGEHVARTNGIALLYDDAAVESDRVCRRTRHNISSMLQDVRRGKRTEIDAITGALVEEGRRGGVRTPVNEMLLERVRELTGGVHQEPEQPLQV